MGRAKFAKSLSGVLRPGCMYFMLCFSDRAPISWGGPRRVSKVEIKKAFKDGWRVDYIRAADSRPASNRTEAERGSPA